MTDDDRLPRLAELVVRLGANVQPGQIVALSSEPGQEPLARAIARAAYEHGAKFVDQRVFDPHLKRARALYADPETLGFVPPWLGERVRALGEHRCAVISLTGPVEPHVMDGVDPELLGRDMLPRLRESNEVLSARTTNWTVAPCPNPGWAELVHPELDRPAALDRLWADITHACRLDEVDPVAAWAHRLDGLLETAAKLDGLRLQSLRFEGPGTDLTVGLLPGSRWRGARFSTIEGIVHVPNVPTEEVFTTPDPERTEGVVTSTKPLLVSGAVITGLRVRFQCGRAVEIQAEQGAGALRELAARDSGAARLGEVALVDRESRIGELDTIFFDTLLDENAASHIALGQSIELSVEGEESAGRANQSEIHVDFMIGGNEVSVTGVAADGGKRELLRDGAWQL
jgi:aminopeptidase